MHGQLTEKELELLGPEFLYQQKNGCLLGAYCEEGLPIYCANEEAAALMGYDSLAEMMAASDGQVSSLICPKDLPQVMKEIGSDFYEGKRFESTHRVRRKDGTGLWLVLKGKIIRTEQGRWAVVCLCEDVSELAEQKKELEQQKFINDTMMKNIPGGYHRCSTSQGYPFRYMSERFLEILGWTEEEIQTKFHNSFLDLVHPDDRELTLHYENRICAPANGDKYQEQIYRLQGKQGYLWVADTTMRMEIAGETFFQGFIYDITPFVREREAREKQLEKLRAKQLNSLEVQLDMERQYLDVICRNYILVYYVDLETDSAEVLKVDSHSNVWQMPGMRTGEHFRYRQHVRQFAQQYVVNSKGLFLKMLDNDYISRKMKTTARYTFRYEGVPNRIGNHHYEVEVIRIHPETFDDKVIIVSQEIDDIIHAEQQHQAELDAERQYLDALCWDYTAVYRVNLEKDVAIPLKVEAKTFVAQSQGFALREEYSYTQHMNAYCRAYVEKADQQNVMAALNPENLLQKLRKQNRFVFRYCSIPSPGGYVYFEGQAIRFPDSTDEEDILLSFRHVDDVVAEERRHQAELDRERQYQDMLSRDFTSVYHVNLGQDLATPLKLGDRTGTVLLHTRVRQRLSYSEIMSSYCSSYLLESGRTGFTEFMARGNLLKSLRTMERCAYRYRCKPDAEGHEHFEVQAIRLNDDPADTNVLVAFRHIDDVVTAEQQRQFELEERLERERTQNEDFAALGSNYNAVFRIDLENDSYINISCQDAIRHYYSDDPSAAAMLEDMCSKIVHEKYYESMLRFFDLSTLARRLRHREFVEAECITKKGTWHRTRLIAKRRNDAGEVIHVLYVTQIINDEKQYEEHLIAKAEYADLANQSKSSFVSQVAHDIRTPMNSIFGFLQIAEANLDDMEKVRYSLGKIRTAGEFLRNLVNDVLDISRMEDGKVTLRPEKVSFSRILGDISTPVQVAAQEKNQTFRVEIHDIFHDCIVADVLRMMQIYTNVLSNAVKYTPEGGLVVFTVSQEEIPGSGKVRLLAQVADTGMGMSEELMKNMFNKFERGTDTCINKISGYGLGLSIVKQLVELMNGTIAVQSAPGEGTTFRIGLEVPYVPEAPREEAEPTMDYGAACAGMHLLVAEDNALNREVITELLAMQRITCECAADGAACVEHFRRAPEGTYDAILMDMQMPVMDGIEATRQIRALELPWAKTVPIFAMTANAMKDDVKRCLEAGMNRHLSKPVDMPEMLKALAQATPNC